MASRPISPAEPTKKHPPPIQLNPHPYAIKTTSSALLSRSNSSPHSAHHTRHHYVPSAPSRIPAASRVRHRYSSSLPLVEGEGEMRTVPALLPTPPSTIGASQDNSSMSSLRHVNELKPTHRTRRAETMPPVSTSDSVTEQHVYDYNHDQDSRSELYAGLPPNPKQWNTDELVTYLETSLRSGNTADGGGDDPGLVAILECVRTRGFTGRELLRLTDSDLAGAPLSDIQRAQVLECSRTLRADVLRGRVYVDSYHSHEVSDNSNDIFSQSIRSSTPYHSIKGASMSADDLHFLLDNTSEGVFPPSPIMSLHRSDLVSDASAQRYRDLARMRMRRRGRVKGLIETWERASTSGSECSASEEESVSGSEAESEDETNLGFEPISDTKRSPDSPSDLSSALPHDEPSRDVRSSIADSTIVLQEPPSLTPPPPYTHLHATLGVAGEEEEEPSIEELLASSSSIPLRGARAWEADFVLGETVKRIPDSANADVGSVSCLVTEPGASRPNNDGPQTRGDSVRSKRSGGSTRSRRKNAKTQRVVTAIFTGSLDDDVSENVGDQIHLVDRHHRARGQNGVVHDEALDPQNDSDSALRALEESIAEIRVQMNTFRVRLEEVEADTARLDTVLERDQCSNSHQSSESDLKQRRLQPAQTTERPRDETLAGERRKTMSLGDIAYTVVSKAIGWLFPYGHLGTSAREDQDQSRIASRPGGDDRHLSPTKRSRPLQLARVSCGIILVSFAICAAVLRRMGFGRWVRRP